MDLSENLELAKVLYKCLIENMNISSLRAALDGKIQYDTNWRQIKLLEELIKSIGSNDIDARKLTDPLRGLNKLRVADAHILNDNLEEAFSLLGCNKVPGTPRESWNFCFDAVIQSMNEISAIINSYISN